MLYEIKNVRQDAVDLKKQWFFDHDTDLLVWRDSGGDIAGFQLCYHKQTDPHALTWFRDKGFRHNRIDYGEEKFGRRRGSPILTPDGDFQMEAVAGRFAADSRNLDPAVASFVLEKLRHYAAGRKPP